MRIALRPSGGRGDYELAGSYNGLHASDLLEKKFSFLITPNLLVRGKSEAHRLSGKPRIRPIGSEQGRHPYVVLASILLLPSPRRELIKTPDHLPELVVGDYTVAGIDIDVVSNNADNVTFAPTNVWAKSRGGLLRVDFAERMALITAIWNSAEGQSSEIGQLLKAHKASVESSEHILIEKNAKAIQRHFGVDTDVIPLLLAVLGLADDDDSDSSGISSSVEGFETEDNNLAPSESLLQRIIKWRRQADRGPGARAFSNQVKEAYNYRCLFSGELFPRFEGLVSSGVDGAHILPWSSHQLNAVVNGICLCKQCHWGFDNGLLRLDFDEQDNSYLLIIPVEIESAAIAANFDIHYFKRNAGRIDPARLPANQNLWPSKAHIRDLNSGSTA